VASQISAIPAVLTAPQVAALLSVHLRYVQELVRSGRLRASRVGKQLRFFGSDVHAFLEAQPAYVKGRAVTCYGRPLPRQPRGGISFGSTLTQTTPEPNHAAE
jgi:excisionase family DNA binding protein